MGVYIKGMDMPTEGKYNCTLYVCSDGSAYIEVGSFPEGNDKFLVASIPPHGRLIDVDYADEYAYDELELAHTYRTGWEAARSMQKIYQNVPTIIQAEPEGEE